MDKGIFDLYFKKFCVDTGISRKNLKKFSDEKILDLNSMFETIEEFGMYAKRKWYINEEKKIIYLNNNLDICKFIIQNCKDENGKILFNKEIISKELPIIYKDFFKFTYVMNPYERLIYFYENQCSQMKLQIKKEAGISNFNKENYLLGYLRCNLSFEDFIEKVVKIPDECADENFIPQYYKIYANEECLVNYFEKVETFSSLKKIQKKFNLEGLDRYKCVTTPNWFTYYNIRTANLVHEYFKMDFLLLGYEDEYKKLIQYIKKKNF